MPKHLQQDNSIKYICSTTTFLMNILLVGEYSRLHNSLKEGLKQLGHEVTLIGTGDGYKNYPVDISIDSHVFKKPLFKPIVRVLDRFFGINLIEWESAYRFKKQLAKLKNYDVVQLINEHSLKTSPKREQELLKILIAQNKSLFLLSCGTDYTSVKFANDKGFTYSILTPLHNNPKLKKQYQFILKYLQPEFKSLHDFIFKHINGVIASDMDYHIPLLGHEKYLGLLPNPINIDRIDYVPLDVPNKISIFHGKSSGNYIKKGNVFFDEALAIIKDRYEGAVEIISTQDLPYNIYINHYNQCHILLDQVYAYDQGYNALEAMAKGKVVFTGAEQEWLEYFNLQEDTVAINALPDVDSIVKKLSWLIEHPEKILEISQNARQFIEKEHNYIDIAKRYLATWELNTKD